MGKTGNLVANSVCLETQVARLRQATSFLWCFLPWNYSGG